MTSSQSAAVRAVDDDQVQPFQLEQSRLRGRLVRLGGALEEILARHAYPEPVAELLAQTLGIAVTLAAALKYEGVFTLQTKGDGPVKMMVADVTSDAAGERALRGYAQYDDDALAALPAERTGVADLLGTGYLAFTVDQGEHTERYQGIVELQGADMAECVQHYFRQSEQLETGIKVAVGRSDGRWRAGALMLQRMPEEGGEEMAAPRASDNEDDWRHAMVLMATLTEAEMVDPALPANDLLYRLFHEGGVRVYEPHAVHDGCRCSRERVENVLRSLPADEMDDLKVDGKVQVSCQFCNRHYEFDDNQLAALHHS
ncbi:MAG TPA: Hsp33 family molecular chaperone HslO [Azospirillaceae bacterium]|nr:Hsp33 family molecular chaperone HslO [Azospirillaceae bacterium]